MKAKTSVGTLVINHYKELKGYNSHKQLKAWAENHQLNTGLLFTQFKRRLFDIGVDYDKLKLTANPKQNKLTSHELTLFCSANATYEKFGITDQQGEILWYGRFFDQANSNIQADADLAAATKAVWFASKVKESNPLIKELKLSLYVDALWLTFQMHDKQTAYILTQMARKFIIDLNISYIDKDKNLARKWSAEVGYKKWSANNLSDLAKPID